MEWCQLINVHTNLVDHSGIDLNGVVFETTTPFLIFSIENQSTSLFKFISTDSLVGPILISS